MNIRARVLLIILWALHEYFIQWRAPAGVWIMQLVSLRGKRTMAEPPKLTPLLKPPQTAPYSNTARLDNYLHFSPFFLYFKLTSQRLRSEQSTVDAANATCRHPSAALQY